MAHCMSYHLLSAIKNAALLFAEYVHSRLQLTCRVWIMSTSTFCESARAGEDICSPTVSTEPRSHVDGSGDLSEHVNSAQTASGTQRVYYEPVDNV